MTKNLTPFVPDWIFRFGLNPIEISVLMALWRYRSAVNGACYPSRQRIAADINASTKSVQRAINRLAEVGLVVWERGNSYQSNRYTLVAPQQGLTVPIRLPEEAPTGTHSPVNRDSQSLQVSYLSNTNTYLESTTVPIQKADFDADAAQAKQYLAANYPDLSFEDYSVDFDVPFGAPNVIHRKSGAIVREKPSASDRMLRAG